MKKITAYTVLLVVFLPVLVSAQTVDSVNVSPEYPLSSQNLSAGVSGSFDSVAYNWYRNGVSQTVLNLPMTNTSPTLDLSSFDNDGTTNNVNYNSSTNSFIFDGSSSYINLGADSSLVGMKEFTLEAYIYTGDDVTDQNQIYEDWYHSTGDRSVMADIYQGKLRFSIGSGSSGDLIESSQNIQTNTWYHISLRFEEGVTRDIWIDGVQDRQDTTPPSSIYISTKDKNIGYLSSLNDRYYEGEIKYVRIWNQSLTPQQIKALNKSLHNTTVSEETSKGEKWNATATPISSAGKNGSTVWSDNTVRVAPYNTCYNLTHPSIMGKRNFENFSCQLKADASINSELNLSNVTLLVNTSTYITLLFNSSSDVSAVNLTVKGVDVDSGGASCQRPETTCSSGSDTCNDLFGCKWVFGFPGSCDPYSCSGLGEQGCASSGECVWTGGDKGHSVVKFEGVFNITDSSFRNLGIDDVVGSEGLVVNGSGVLRDVKVRDAYYSLVSYNSSARINGIKSSYSAFGFVDNVADNVVSGLEVNHTDYGAYLSFDNNTIRDSEVYNFTKHGIIADSNTATSDNNLFENLTIYNTNSVKGGDCIKIDNSNNNTINNSKLYNCSDSGGSYYELYISDGSQQNIIGNTVFGGGDSYGVVVDGHNTTFNNITGKHYKGGSGWDSVVNLGWNNLAYDNTIKNSLFFDVNDVAIYIYGDSNSVTNSTFYNNTLSGSYAGVDVDGSRNIIADNTFEDEYRGIESGIWWSTLKNNNFSNNIFYNIASRSVFLGANSENTSVWNNNFLDANNSDSGSDNQFCVGGVGNFYNQSVQREITDCGIGNITNPSQNGTALIGGNNYTYKWEKKDGTGNFNYTVNVTNQTGSIIHIAEMIGKIYYASIIDSSEFNKTHYIKVTPYYEYQNKIFRGYEYRVRSYQFQNLPEKIINFVIDVQENRRFGWGAALILGYSAITAVLLLLGYILLQKAGFWHRIGVLMVCLAMIAALTVSFSVFSLAKKGKCTNQINNTHVSFNYADSGLRSGNLTHSWVEKCIDYPGLRNVAEKQYLILIGIVTFFIGAALIPVLQQLYKFFRKII